MNNSNQSNWLFEQMVTYLQMDTLSNDIYDKLTALTENLGAGILTLKGNITQAGSNVTIPIGAFRFADASYVFLPYQTGIFGFADTQTLVVSGDGYIVARYSVTPTVANATNYSFPTAYYFVATPNATTDCVICTITAGVISSYGNFLINSAASQTEVNAGTINNKAVTPKTLSNATVPTRPIGEQSEFIANMQALWNQTRGIGIGLNSQTSQTFNTVSDLTTQTVNGGCYLADGLAMPTPSDAYYMTRIASREVSNNSAFMATLLSDSSFTYIGQFYDGIFGWIRLATVEQFQNGTFAAILLSLAANSATLLSLAANSATLLSLAANSATLGTAGVTTGAVSILGDQPTPSANLILRGNGGVGNASYIWGAYDGVDKTSFINFPYKLSNGVTFARPCLGNSNAASDQIAKLADITANGGGIVASGTTSSVTWVKFANGLLLQYSNNTVVTGAVINFPVSFTAIPQVVSSSIDLNAGAQSAWVQLKSIGPTGFFATAYTATNLPTTNTIGLSWLAIGYSNA